MQKFDDRIRCGLAEAGEFPGPVYERMPRGMRRPRPSLVRRVLNWGPLQEVLSARIGFAARFDRDAGRVEAGGGSALAASQAQFHFRDRLLLTVDASTITERLPDFVIDRGAPRWIGSHFLDGSDWRAVRQPIDGSPSHLEVIEIGRLRADFRSGARYQEYAKKIRAGQSVRRNRVALDTIEKLDSYFGYYLALIESIEAKGLQSQSTLGLIGQTGRMHRFTRSLWQDLAERDIGVAIDADGTLVRHTSGKHRMAAAKALGLTRIPVEVRLVHARWLCRQADRLGLAPHAALEAVLAEARANGWSIT